MVEGKKGEIHGEQHSLSLANSSCEISKRQDLPFMGSKDRHRHTVSSQEKCHSEKKNPDRAKWRAQPLTPDVDVDEHGCAGIEELSVLPDGV